MKYDLRSEQPFSWNGILDPAPLADDVVAAGHRLANAAKAGDWTRLFAMLEEPGRPVDVNWWRPGGTAWFGPLHQAAWHGAPVEVSAELVRRGALRSLVDSRGRTPYDVRVEQDAAGKSAKGFVAHKHASLVLRSFLKPPPSPFGPERIRVLDTHLAGVIDARIGRLVEDLDPRRALRYPPVAILHEVPGQRVWFPVPGMYGGFDITLGQGHLDVRSWSRVVGGSGQVHRITHEGAVLVDDGFV